MVDQNPENRLSAISSMLRSMDRYESLTSLFADSFKASVNQPLLSLTAELPKHLDVSQPLEELERNVHDLVSYIHNPLNRGSTTIALFKALVDFIHGADARTANCLSRLILKATLSEKTNDSAASLAISLTTFAAPLLRFLLPLEVADLQKAVFLRLTKPGRQNPRGEHRARLISLFRILFDRSLTSCPSFLTLTELSSCISAKKWTEIDLLKPLSNFFDSFKRSAVVFDIQHREFMFPVIGFTHVNNMLWNIDKSSLQITNTLSLELCDIGRPPQESLIRYLLCQRHSRHMLQSMLRLVKGQGASSSGLEEQMIELIFKALLSDSPDEEIAFYCWHQISSQFIVNMLCGFIQFGQCVEKLSSRLGISTAKPSAQNASYLLWMLYQYVTLHSESLPARNFIGSLKLYRDLFPFMDPLPVPEVLDKYSVVRLSPAFLWTHLEFRAERERLPIPYGRPAAVYHLLEFVHRSLDKSVMPHAFASLYYTFEHVAAVNAFVPLPPVKEVGIPTTTKMDYAGRVAETLLEPMKESLSMQTSTSPFINQGPCRVYRATKPLSMALLDTTSSHIKRILFRSIGPLFTVAIQNWNPRDAHSIIHLSPAFWETCSRLLLYEELESVLFEYFCRELPQRATTSPAVIGALFETLSFRVMYIPVSYKCLLMVLCLSLLNQNPPQPHHPHLIVMCEQLLFRLMQSFTVEEFPRMQKFILDNRHLLTADLEEMTRLVLLTCIRLAQVSGMDASNTRFIASLIQAVQQNMPHTWTPVLLNTFHPQIQMLYSSVTFPSMEERRGQIRQYVDNMVQRIHSISEQEVGNMLMSQQFIQYHPFIYCIIFKVFLDGGDPGVPFKASGVLMNLLDKIGYKGQLRALRHLVDHLLHELKTNLHDKGTRLKECLGAMVWKYGLVVFDRLLFVLLMRYVETPQDHQLCLLLVSLMVKSPEYMTRSEETLNIIPADYWNLDCVFEKVTAYYERQPESISFVYNQPGFNQQGNMYPQVPVYFSNVVLRCVPLIDIYIFRCMDAGRSFQYVDLIPEAASTLRYHNRPMLFLWNTVTYHDKVIRDNVNLKRTLMRYFLANRADLCPPNFYFSPLFSTFLNSNNPESYPISAEYFQHVLSQMVRAMYSQNSDEPFGRFDWRFHEFPSPVSHCLHMTALEILTLPWSQDQVVDHLLQLIWNLVPVNLERNDSDEDRWKSYLRLVNCAALIIASLPLRYFVSILRHLEPVLKDTELSSGTSSNWDLVQCSSRCKQPSVFLHLFLNIILQSNVGHIVQFLETLQSSVVPLVGNEDQWMFVFALVGPVVQKAQQDVDTVNRLMTVLLVMLRNVVQAAGGLKEPYLIVDMLYNAKQLTQYQVPADLVSQLFGVLPEKLRTDLGFLFEQQAV